MSKREERERENGWDAQKVRLRSNVAHPRRPSSMRGYDGWLSQFPRRACGEAQAARCRPLPASRRVAIRTEGGWSRHAAAVP
jgi:hypothetical protein